MTSFFPSADVQQVFIHINFCDPQRRHHARGRQRLVPQVSADPWGKSWANDKQNPLVNQLIKHHYSMVCHLCIRCRFVKHLETSYRGRFEKPRSVRYVTLCPKICALNSSTSTGVQVPKKGKAQKVHVGCAWPQRVETLQSFLGAREATALAPGGPRFEKNVVDDVIWDDPGTPIVFNSA